MNFHINCQMHVSKFDARKSPRNFCFDCSITRGKNTFQTNKNVVATCHCIWVSNVQLYIYIFFSIRFVLVFFINWEFIVCMQIQIWFLWKFSETKHQKIGRKLCMNMNAFDEFQCKNEEAKGTEKKGTKKQERINKYGR